MSYTRFEWDEAKSRSNARKHGLSFDTAVGVFEQPHLVQLDTRQEYGEDRWIAVGLIGLVVCIVVYTDRMDQRDTRTIRIISARKATRRECERLKQKIGH